MTEYNFKIINGGECVGVLDADGMTKAIADGVLKEGDIIEVEELA